MPSSKCNLLWEMGKKRKRVSSSSKPFEGPRRHYSAQENEDSEQASFNTARGYIDPYTGQRGAFPGLDEHGDEFFCGPANDGIDYLRMVRYVLNLLLLSTFIRC